MLTHWTFFRHRTQSHNGLRMVMDRDELAHALGDAGPATTPKIDVPLICPVHFRGDHRLNANVEHVYTLAHDLDGHEMPINDPDATLQAFSEALGGVEVFAYSSYSSTRDAYRLHTFTALAEPATADQHPLSWAMSERILASAGIVVDPQCKDPARGYFKWCIPPNSAYWHGHVDGLPWDAALAAAIETEFEEEAQAARARASRRPTVVRARGDLVTRARAYITKMPLAISGSGGHVATFNVARTLVADFELADADALELLTEYSDRCSPPWSERELLHKIKSANGARVRRDMDGGT